MVTRTLHKLSRAGIIAALATFAAPALAAPTTGARDYSEHFFECLHFMLFDSAAHAENCLPSNQANFTGLPQTGGSGRALRILPPPTTYVVVVVSERSQRRVN